MIDPQTMLFFLPWRSSSFKHIAEVQPTSTQLPRTPIAAKMTTKVASNIGAESMQYRHYKRPHEDADDDDQYRDRDYDSSSSDARKLLTGVSGPVHTYIKTDKNANFKWGVRHFAGRRYRGWKKQGKSTLDEELTVEVRTLCGITAAGLFIVAIIINERLLAIYT